MTAAAVREREREKRAEMYEVLQRKVMQEGPFVIMLQDWCFEPALKEKMTANLRLAGLPD